MSKYLSSFVIDFDDFENPRSCLYYLCMWHYKFNAKITQLRELKEIFLLKVLQEDVQDRIY